MDGLDGWMGAYLAVTSGSDEPGFGRVCTPLIGSESSVLSFHSITPTAPQYPSPPPPPPQLPLPRPYSQKMTVDSSEKRTRCFFDILIDREMGKYFGLELNCPD